MNCESSIAGNSMEGNDLLESEANLEGSQLGDGERHPADTLGPSDHTLPGCPGRFSDTSKHCCLSSSDVEPESQLSKFTSRQDMDFTYSIFQFLNLPSISNIRKFVSPAHARQFCICVSESNRVCTAGDGREALRPQCLPRPHPSPPTTPHN